MHYKFQGNVKNLVKARLGLMRYCSNGKRYQQVRYPHGGGLRVTEVPHDSTIETLKDKAISIFFEDQDISDKTFSIGTFNGKAIERFTDLKGNECSYNNYMKARGLFSSRHHLYLLVNPKETREVERLRPDSLPAETGQIDLARPESLPTESSQEEFVRPSTLVLSRGSTPPMDDSYCTLLSPKVGGNRKREGEIQYCSTQESSFSEVLFTKKVS